jgi:hypothetical protein
LQPGQFIFGRRKASAETGLSEREIRTILELLKSLQNITIKTTNKFSVITIVNWHTYQSGTDENDQQATNKNPKNDQQNEQQKSKKRPQTRIIYSSKEEYNASLFSQISSLSEKYSDQQTVNEIFQAIASTRKSNRITDTVKLKILRSWEKYPEDQVMAGIRIFLDRKYQTEGKREEYLLAIIRNQERKSEVNNAGGADQKKTMPSTGSALMDDHYRKQGFTIMP